MINSGKYNHKITIKKEVRTKDKDGFPVTVTQTVLEPYANIKTTRGYTLIQNDSDFEQAYTNFTIRYPVTKIDRDMIIEFRGETYTIEYLNNVNEAGAELELQAKKVVH